MDPAFVVWIIAVSIGAGALGGALGMTALRHRTDRVGDTNGAVSSWGSCLGQGFVTRDMRRYGGLEQLLARVLYLGSLLACSIIALGIIFSLFHWGKEIPSATGIKVVAAGISLFIFFPTLRVGLIFSAFVRDRDLLF